MRNSKDVLRFKYVSKLSHERIAVALGIAKGVVTKYAGLASAAGLDWELVQPMDETQLHNRLINYVAPQCSIVLPNYGVVHQELRRKGMTLMLLWEEHVEQHGHGHQNTQLTNAVLGDGLKAQALMRDSKAYIHSCLQSKTKYCRIVWRMEDGKRRWFGQLVQDGVAPAKYEFLALRSIGVYADSVRQTSRHV